MAEIQELAVTLGRALGRTPEYQALTRALRAADDDRDIVELRNEIVRLESGLQSSLGQGQEPTEEQIQEYESALQRLQALPGYQRLVAEQTNFDKVMAKVNAAIQEGMKEGTTSRIIIPS